MGLHHPINQAQHINRCKIFCTPNALKQPVIEPERPWFLSVAKESEGENESSENLGGSFGRANSGGILRDTGTREKWLRRALGGKK